MKLKNKKLYLLIIGTVLALSILIGISYSYYAANVKDISKTQTYIKTNTLGLTYTGETEINCDSMVPGNKCVKTFKVKNTSNIAVYYNIYMENITNEFNEDLVYTLTDENGEVIGETVLPETNAGKTYLKKGITIDPSPAEKTYTLTIEYKYLDTPQNDYQGAEFKATVGIDTEQTRDLYTLTGTVVKLLNGGETETVTSGNLVFFSERQDIAIQSDGTFEATNLEQGNHAVYYMGTQDITGMTVDQIKENAQCYMKSFDILTTTRVELTCKPGEDQIEIKDIIPTPQTNNNNNNILCKRATTLHTETCSQTYNRCIQTGYTNGDKITYGNEIVTNGELNSGDAFDCDVNGNGLIDTDEEGNSAERFYYLSKYYNTTTKEFENDTAVLIYYSNTKLGEKDSSYYCGTFYNENGRNYEGPQTAKLQLPTTSQWNNVSLKNIERAILNYQSNSTVGSGESAISLPTAYSYEGYAARLPIYQEITAACGEVYGKSLYACEYLLQNTPYSTSGKIEGYWLDSPYWSYNEWSGEGQVLRVDGVMANIYDNYANSTGGNSYPSFGVRPVIDVPLSRIEY